MGGFTLLELALALLVVALAGGLFLTWAARSRHRRHRDEFVRDLRDISIVFVHYQLQHGAWPPSSSVDVALPPDLVEALKPTGWFKGSPFGGEYGWIAPDTLGVAGRGSARGAVIVTAFSPGFPLTLHRSDLLAIDRLIDDGNLETGRFRTGFNGWPVYHVEAAKK